jgi:hypothetical protein
MKQLALELCELVNFQSLAACSLVQGHDGSSLIQWVDDG